MQVELDSSKQTGQFWKEPFKQTLPEKLKINTPPRII